VRILQSIARQIKYHFLGNMWCRKNKAILVKLMNIYRPTHVQTVNVCASRTGGLEFKSCAGQILQSVVNSSSLLEHLRK